MDSYKVTQARRKRGKLGIRGNAPEGAERKKKNTRKRKREKLKFKIKGFQKESFFLLTGPSFRCNLLDVERDYEG